jgi:hypothetical protein
MSKLRVQPKLLAAFIVVCAVLSGLLVWLAGMPFWGAFLIVAVALVVNGLVAEVEDRAPGGFLNPKGKSK